MSGTDAPRREPAPQLLTRKDLQAITAVLDIALNARGRPVSAGALAERHGLSPRHLEPVLQMLVRHGLLKGVRGPRGGYELARERRRISVADILRAARLAEPEEAPVASDLLNEIVAPAVAEAERAFEAAVSAITLEDLVRRVAAQRGGNPPALDFTI